MSGIGDRGLGKLRALMMIPALGVICIQILISTVSGRRWRR